MTFRSKRWKKHTKERSPAAISERRPGRTRRMKRRREKTPSPLTAGENKRSAWSGSLRTKPGCAARCLSPYRPAPLTPSRGSLLLYCLRQHSRPCGSLHLTPAAAAPHGSVTHRKRIYGSAPFVEAVRLGPLPPFRRVGAGRKARTRQHGKTANTRERRHHGGGKCQPRSRASRGAGSKAERHRKI